MDKITKRALVLGTAVSLMTLSSFNFGDKNEKESKAVVSAKNVCKRVRDVLVHYPDTTYIYKDVDYNKGKYKWYGTEGMGRVNDMYASSDFFNSPDGKTHINVPIELGIVKEKCD